MIYRKLKGYKYELLNGELIEVPQVAALGLIENKYITLDNGILLIKKHYAWDGPSGPTLDTKTFMRGSLVHDSLYQLMREGLLPRIWRKYTDKLLRDICLEDGMKKFRAWYVYHSVRTFAKKSSMPRKKPRGGIVELPRN